MFKAIIFIILAVFLYSYFIKNDSVSDFGKNAQEAISDLSD